MQEQPPRMDRDIPPSEETLPASGQDDRIVVGNMDHTVAAVGRGASVIYYQALSRADQAREVEDYEREKLAQAVGELIKTLYDQMRAAQPGSESPYKYLLPFEFRDAWRFFGRESFRDEVLAAARSADLRYRLMVLHGEAGMGKTSLLRAAIGPALVAQGHLPLLVRVSHEPVSTSVKRALLRNLAPLEMIQEAPLCEFLHQVHALLPPGKRVYLMVDQFENFFDQPATQRERFSGELADCLLAETGVGHWLISVQSARVGFLSTLAPAVPQPLANTLMLPPLNAEGARDAITKPAALAGLAVEPALVDELLRDLGGDAVDPSRLQLVCHTLAEGAKRGQPALTRADYVKAGRAETILRDHLTLVLKHNLLPEDSEAAWLALSTVAAHTTGAPREALLAELKTYEVPGEQCQRVLENLEQNRLIRLREQGYHLTSPSLREPIRKWEEQRAALEQAQAEARRQLERVRDSALRGLFGGGGGLMLAYLLTNLNQTIDLLVLPVVALFDGLLGGVAGIAYLFALDIARASFHGRRRWLQVLWGGLAGGLAFGGAFFFHKLLHFQPFEQIFLGALEGGLWGLAAGAGIALLLLLARPYWQTVPILAAFSALALWVGERFGGVFRRPRIAAGGEAFELWLLLAGALMFLALAGATLWGKRREAGRPEIETQPNQTIRGLS